MRKGIFNTTDPDYSAYNGQEVSIFRADEFGYVVGFSDLVGIAARKEEVELLPEEPRMSNQDIIDVIQDLVDAHYEPATEEEAQCEYARLTRAGFAIEELRRREESL
jgi:hypothetical protein